MYDEIVLHLCQVEEKGLENFLSEIQRDYPSIEIHLHCALGLAALRIRSMKEQVDVDQVKRRLVSAFRTQIFQAATIEEAVHDYLIEKKLTIALAESCTGGALSYRLVKLGGSSRYLLGSIVAYSNEWKTDFLKVPLETLEQQGAVSRETVCAMARGLFSQTKADWAIAVSGFAGPTSQEKNIPVGTIYIAVCERQGMFDVGNILVVSSRIHVIEYAVNYALSALFRRLAYQMTTFS